MPPPLEDTARKRGYSLGWRRDDTQHGAAFGRCGHGCDEAIPAALIRAVIAASLIVVYS